MNTKKCLRQPDQAQPNQREWDHELSPDTFMDNEMARVRHTGKEVTCTCKEQNSSRVSGETAGFAWKWKWKWKWGGLVRETPR